MFLPALLKGFALGLMLSISEDAIEKNFVSNSIFPYLYIKGFSNVRTITIETSPGFKGGDVRYTRYKSNIIQLLNGKESLILFHFRVFIAPIFCPYVLRLLSVWLKPKIKSYFVPRAEAEGNSFAN